MNRSRKSGLQRARAVRDELVEARARWMGLRPTPGVDEKLVNNVVETYSHAIRAIETMWPRLVDDAERVG